MKRIFDWQVVLGLILVALSAAVYIIHYLIFRDAHHIFVYLIGDIAFVFIEVLLVTLIIHKALNEREKRSMLMKLNMVIGTFYSETGTGLLKRFSDFDPGADKIRKDLTMTVEWSEKEFAEVSSRIKDYGYVVEIKRGDIEGLKEFLGGKTGFLLNLLQNPNLLEHETFTDLLWAVFHLAEELSYRGDLKSLPVSDLEHLSGDVKRAYVLLVIEWLSYLRHLKANYPYLFSLAVRTNPFNPEAKVVIEKKT